MAKVKTIKDHNGYPVPVSAIPKIELLKDKTAQQMAKKFEDMNKKLQVLKDWTFDKADELSELQLKYYELEGRDTSNFKGGFSFYSYDKTIKVEVNVGQRLEFDDKINLAKAEIDEYCKELTAEQNADIITIVNGAFTTSRGNLDHKKILQLFSYKIKHPRWLKAMEILKESITTNHSKRYIKVSVKNENGEYEQINIQFSSL